MVVYEEEPTAAAALLARDRAYAPYSLLRQQGGPATT
jgi:hypothetical protein